ncbi:MAG: hypothetical protein N3D15_03140, partial [Syntrophorhabdaceae bacterium]|nr:hypothetical protein [Syntrophorhabdaceae bacterium]
MNILKRYWWILVVLFIAIYPITLGNSPYKTGILVFVGIYIMLAVGLDLLMGYGGQISVGHAAFFAIGAYTSGIMTARYGLPPLIGIASGMFLSAALAWAVGRPVLALKEYY